MGLHTFPGEARSVHVVPSVIQKIESKQHSKFVFGHMHASRYVVDLMNDDREQGLKSSRLLAMLLLARPWHTLHRNLLLGRLPQMRGCAVRGGGLPSQQRGPGSVVIIRNAFTPEECKWIVATFKNRVKLERVRCVFDAVSERKFLQIEPWVDIWKPKGCLLTRSKFGKDCLDVTLEYNWILERVIAMVIRSGVPTTGEASPIEWGFDVTACTPRDLASDHLQQVDLHEFEGGDFLDWHRDTYPTDGTGRTVNVNIMLSERGDEYHGGDIHVGKVNCHANVGDLYWYPAAYPHKVDDITSGIRHTLVFAVKAKNDSARASTGYNSRADRNFQSFKAWRAEATSEDTKYAEHFDRRGQQRLAVKVGDVGGGGVDEKHVEQVEEMVRRGWEDARSVT